MANKQVVIWGAGRIGRGFLADLFDAADYQIIFVDQSQELVGDLLRAGKYTVVRARNAQDRDDRIITGYSALTTSQTREVEMAVTTADSLVVAVFPKVFPTVAAQLAPGILRRFQERPESFLDIILCTNLAHAALQFRQHLQNALPPEHQAGLMDRIGVVETLVIRIVAEPPADELRKDPLLVWTNGFPELPIDRNAFKGDIPQIPGLRLVENMRAEEMRKLYTYNACHAALAYLGALRGHERIVDCLADPVVRADAEGVLNEASLALQIEYGFSPGEMDMWNADVIDRTNNPTLGDTVTRYGADPRRKLKRADRLVGPTLLARKHNLDTRYLVRAIAAGFLFQSPDDEGAAYVQERIKTAGLEATISEVCELSPAEGDLVRETAVAFQRLSLEKKWAELAVQAERLGFEYEKTYHGCGQCCLAAILETIDHFDNAVFEAATGLSGGLGQAGDGTCGALMAGALAIGLTYPRRRSFFDGDRANKYRTFDMIQRLRQRYLDAYGGLTCHSVHRSIAGRAYDLRDAEEGKAFEAAGAHDDKCTNVVARAARWTVEIIGQELIEDQISSEPPGEGE